MKIVDLKAGENVTDFECLLSKVVVGKTNGKNRSTYLNITLQDSSGELNAKLWNATEAQVAEITEGNVVKVSGDVIRYNNDRQMKVLKLSIVGNDESLQVKYLQQAPLPSDEIMERIYQFVEHMENQKYHDIVLSLLKEREEEFKFSPAASKNHHEFVSGLAYHTYCMLRLAKGLSQLYPSVNTDILYAGVILHDYGKIVELSGPAVPHYTTPGKLLGHITIGTTMVAKKAEELNIEGEEVMILQHMILSHHGKNEFGSPVLPQLREAELLTLIDNIDARMMMLDKALELVEPGEFSSRIFPLENRSFYKPSK